MRKRVLLLVIAGAIIGALPLAVRGTEEGFVPLFRDSGLSGWTVQGAAGCYFLAADDTLVYDKEKGGGKLWSPRDYTNFVIRFEFCLSENCNNGLAVRTPHGEHAATKGMEIQMIGQDDRMYTEDFPKNGYYLNSYQRHGAVYGVIPPKERPDGTSYLRPHGEWNEQEVTLDGPRVKVVLNGTTIVDDDLSRYPDDRPLMDGAKHPGIRNTAGRLAWLSHGFSCKWRNVRIKELRR